ncbi:MAG: hypothetical protein CV081_04390 [Nitrospira sp. LK265]|nr:hypothetical protein [Nitrospira sp. LK265]
MFAGPLDSSSNDVIRVDERCGWRGISPVLVMTVRDGVRPILRGCRTALRDAGINDFRFHDLRHCASTNLRRAGVDTATAMKIVGHKSEKMWKRYNSIEEKDLTDAAVKVQKYLDVNTLITPGDMAVEGHSSK